MLNKLGYPRGQNPRPVVEKAKKKLFKKNYTEDTQRLRNWWACVDTGIYKTGFESEARNINID